MKVIEGFHIKNYMKGSKKGEEYIKFNKRYVWKIPVHLEGQIDKGDIVITHSKEAMKNFKNKVLVVNILDVTDGEYRSILSIHKKCENKK